MAREGTETARDGSGGCPSCGGHHGQPLDQVVVGSEALEALAVLVERRGWRRLLVVADANTAEVLGAEVADRLAAAGPEVGRVTFAERHGLLADETGVERIRRALVSGEAEAAVAVGSGTLNDLTRYASFLEGLPYCSVPTAASMDGYASGVAAMQFGGVKVSYPAQTPLGIFADPAVLAAAPREMTAWGLGDLLGKASACFDWRLGRTVTGEPYCAAIEARVLDPVRSCTEGAAGVLAGDEAGVRTLLSGLVESGVAMALQGNSRPASGSEHHVSHLLDLLAFRGLRAHFPHGLQVGYATRLVNGLQRACLPGLAEALVRPNGQEPGGRRTEEEGRWLGEDAPALAAVREEKAAAYARYGPSWPPGPEALSGLTARLSELTALFGPVADALELAGIPAGPGFLEVDAEMLGATLRYANRLRSRFTVLDLLEHQGRLEEQIEELLGG